MIESPFVFHAARPTFSSLEKFSFQDIPPWLTWYIYVVARIIYYRMVAPVYARLITVPYWYRMSGFRNGNP